MSSNKKQEVEKDSEQTTENKVEDTIIENTQEEEDKEEINSRGKKVLSDSGERKVKDKNLNQKRKNDRKNKQSRYDNDDY